MLEGGSQHGGVIVNTPLACKNGELRLSTSSFQCHYHHFLSSCPVIHLFLCFEDRIVINLW